MVLIAGGLVLNVLLYVVVVRPLARSVANIEQSTLAAEQARAAAQTEFGRANGTLTGKDRATKELATFYSTVLAQDLSGARRLTYGRVQRLAEQFRLEYQRSRYEPVEERGSTLTKLKVERRADRQLQQHAQLHPRHRDGAGVRGHREHLVGRGQRRGIAASGARPLDLLPERSLMSGRTRQLAVLVVLLIVGAVGYWMWPWGGSGAGTTGSASGRGGGRAQAEVIRRSPTSDSSCCSVSTARCAAPIAIRSVSSAERPRRRLRDRRRPAVSLPSRLRRLARCHPRRLHRSHSGSSGSCSRRAGLAALRY